MPRPVQAGGITRYVERRVGRGVAVSSMAAVGKPEEDGNAGRHTRASGAPAPVR